jgi:predicted DNA-binding transcriptional regulator YafY
MAETSARLLRLLDLLQQQPDWTGTELANRLGVTTRTVRKDISRLRGLGYPVDANPGVAGGYRLAAGAHLPPLLLDDEEAVAIAIGLRTAAYAGIVGIEETSLRAVTKLEQMLPDHLRRRVSALQSAVEPLRWTSQNALVEPESLAVISQACRDREQVRFDYADKAGTETRRLVEPEKLVLVGHRWYLAAWDTRREDWRTFRLDRLTRPRLAGVRTRPRPLPDGAADASEYVSRSISATERRIEASILVHAPFDAARSAIPEHVGTLEPVGPNDARLRVDVENLEWLALRLGLIDLDFTVETPDDLRDVLRRVGARMVAGASREA